MTEKLQIYRCNVCGNLVEVLSAGAGTLVCCGQPMELLKELIEDVGKEKHVPVVERTDTGVKVKIGEIPHPMEEKHYIEWVEITANGEAYRRFLKPGDPPEAVFKVAAKKVEARAYCNVHSLWKSQA